LPSQPGWLWLADASAGGGLALDAALAAPGRVAGLVVMGTAVSGAPEPELDAATKRFEPLLDKAYSARDAGEINRLETWLWLDGPAQPQGRVGGAARKLALDMNAMIIANDVPETEGAAEVDAWHRTLATRTPPPPAPTIGHRLRTAITPKRRVTICRSHPRARSPIQHDRQQRR
jgi:pimeloyl-ACP methyl ester carboxylesterase